MDAIWIEENHQIRSGKYKVHGMKEVWCLIFQRSFALKQHYVSTMLRCITTAPCITVIYLLKPKPQHTTGPLFKSGLLWINTAAILNTIELIYAAWLTPTLNPANLMHQCIPLLTQHSLYMHEMWCMWFAGSEAGHSSPPQASSWTHSSVTSGLSTTQVRLCCLTMHPFLYLIRLHLSPEKCVFRILKIRWETPFFWPLVPPHCQEKVLFLQIKSHHLYKYLAVRQSLFPHGRHHNIKFHRNSTEMFFAHVDKLCAVCLRQAPSHTIWRQMCIQCWCLDLRLLWKKHRIKTASRSGILHLNMQVSSIDPLPRHIKTLFTFFVAA